MASSVIAMSVAATTQTEPPVTQVVVSTAE
jgi:hypothetical protein